MSDENGCILADVIKGERTDCEGCPFPDCIIPYNGIPSFQSPHFITAAVKAFQQVPNGVLSKLLNVDLKTIRRRQNGENSTSRNTCCSVRTSK
ncbi:hypothetical protein CL622_05640, partial [archaeon]|nr:hypothetical protein [archaeon]